MRNHMSSCASCGVSTKKDSHSSNQARRYFMRKLSLALLMLVALLPWSAPVIAHGPEMGGPPGHHMMGGGFGMLLPPFILNKLNLSDDQKTQIQGIMDDYHKTAQSLFQQLRTA